MEVTVINLLFIKFQIFEGRIENSKGWVFLTRFRSYSLPMYNFQTLTAPEIIQFKVFGLHCVATRFALPSSARL